MSYPHRDLVTAWVSGTPVQFKAPDGLWLDLPDPSTADKVPHFYPRGEYRIRPRVVRYRVADFGRSRRPRLASNATEEFNIAHTPGFVRWLTEWQEVEA